MRRVLVVVGVVASALLTQPGRLAVLGAVAFSGGGCKTCTISITTPDPLPNGQVGHAYFVQMAASGECVRDGAFWLTQGGLPPGMKFSQGGALDGTPTEAGTYTFQITATILDIYNDYKGDPGDSQDFTLTILPRS